MKTPGKQQWFYQQDVPAGWGFSGDLLDQKSVPTIPIPRGGGGVVTNDYCSALFTILGKVQLQLLSLRSLSSSKSLDLLNFNSIKTYWNKLNLPCNYLRCNQSLTAQIDAITHNTCRN